MNSNTDSESNNPQSRLDEIESISVFLATYMNKVSLTSGLRVKKQNKKKTTTTTKQAVAGHVSAGSKLKALFVTLEINLRRLVS